MRFIWWSCEHWVVMFAAILGEPEHRGFHNYDGDENAWVYQEDLWFDQSTYPEEESTYLRALAAAANSSTSASCRLSRSGYSAISAG